MPIPVEEIPDDAPLARLVFFPTMYSDSAELIWDMIFQFPRDQGECECVVWSRYAPFPEGAHAIGSAQQVFKRQRRPNAAYKGYLPALAGAIRGVTISTGHGFTLAHKPNEGDYHVEIYLRQAAGTERITRGEKSELKLALRKAFDALVPSAISNDQNVVVLV